MSTTPEQIAADLGSIAADLAQLRTRVAGARRNLVAISLEHDRAEAEAISHIGYNQVLDHTHLVALRGEIGLLARRIDEVLRHLQRIAGPGNTDEDEHGHDEF